ncbi:hypothetical protein Poli38472_007388 [Pythium oligandrum]|uniref:Uncharacterized protein n=1 Tax=Pythium oligandrum TaxID=41045 RepID=A0A8K1CAQ3_PYTOL|nr:hypothetical protein Poli38472_007388 [Pythium oligandrum]|eukprot:TMW59243.1 hypothetical protein Poli38472_007388 [Pythium oligandrum]
MKTAVLAAVLCATAAASSIHIRVQQSKPSKYDRVKQYKATPWDYDDTLRAEKCKDLCYLQGFYQFQQGRNCFSRPTDLCGNYTDVLPAMDTVLAVAECDCSESS